MRARRRCRDARPSSSTRAVADGERALVEVTLPPASHTVTRRDGAGGRRVYVNGVLQSGKTPQELELADGEFYQLAVEKDGFELTQRAITPDDRDAAA